MFWLHLRNELWKLFGKKRTYIGFGAFILAQNGMLLMFRFTRWQKTWERVLAGNGYLAHDYLSALTVALVMLIPQILLLMPLYTALVGGDLVAKEAEDGTLRMILSRPIARFRLLLVKWLAGIVFAGTLVLALGCTALGFARLWFPWRGMFVYSLWPEHIFNLLTPGHATQLYVCAHLLMTLNASAIVGLAFMFSCFNMKPAAATILALSFLFINVVLEHLPFFEPYQEWFLLYHFRVWLLIFADPIPWDRIMGSLLVLVAFNLTTFLAGTAAFQARDIKS